MEIISQKIQTMFSGIANRYDLANDIFSLGIHRRWRKQALKICQLKKGDKILDLCCGTGDFALEFAKSETDLDILAIDFSSEMINLAKTKSARINLKSIPAWKVADAAKLECNDKFDIISCCFGIRNIPQFEPCLEKYYKLLTPNGRIVILEFSFPRNYLLKTLYYPYLKIVIPALSRLFTGNPRAYHYLADSVTDWNRNVDLSTALKTIGFVNVQRKSLTAGIAEILIGHKD